MAPDPPRNTPAASLSFRLGGLKHPLQPDLWVAALCQPISLGPDPCGVQVPNLGGKRGDLATWTRAEVRDDAGSIHHGTLRAVAAWRGFGRSSCPTLVTARDPPLHSSPGGCRRSPRIVAPRPGFPGVLPSPLPILPPVLAQSRAPPRRRSAACPHLCPAAPGSAPRPPCGSAPTWLRLG